MSDTQTTADIRDSVDYWLTAVVFALRRGDLKHAADAQAVLRERFDVDIRFANLLDRPSQQETAS